MRAQDDDAKARLLKSAFYAPAQTVANTKTELVVPDFYVTVLKRFSQWSDEIGLVFARVGNEHVVEHTSTLRPERFVVILLSQELAFANALGIDFLQRVVVGINPEVPRKEEA
jgi:hypothetical protein